MESRSHCWLLASLVVAACVGCATSVQRATVLLVPGRLPAAMVEQRARLTLAGLFAANGRQVHRAILTAGGRQFTFDGYLKTLPTGEAHLVVLSPMGVITEVRLDPAGELISVKAGMMFREAWAREFVARDLRVLLGRFAVPFAAGVLTDGRAVLAAQLTFDTQVRYIFGADGEEWQEAEIVRGAQRVCRAVVAGDSANVRFEADGYRLDLRVVERRTR